MTKTIYSLTPGEGRSDYADAILGITAAHNMGRVTIDFDVIQGYCKGDWARWNSIRNEPTFKHDKESGILEIWEKEKLAFTVKEKIIEVLEEVQNQGNAKSSES